MSLWTLNGKLIVNAKGQLIECDHCPCESSSESSESSRVPCSGPPKLSLALYCYSVTYVGDQPVCNFFKSSCGKVSTGAPTSISLVPEYTTYAYPVVVEITCDMEANGNRVRPDIYTCRGSDPYCEIQIREDCTTGKVELEDGNRLILLQDITEHYQIELYPTLDDVSNITNCDTLLATYILKIGIQDPSSGESSE